MTDIQELLTRGVEDVVPRDLAEKKLKSNQPITIYLGIDPTGAKLHLGHSVPLRKLKAFVDAGHKVIFLIGNYTAMIGDPTGRDTMRSALTPEQVQSNFERYKEQAGKILDFSKVEIRYNHDWLSKLSFKDVLELAGQFTVQQMISRDMFQKRLEKGDPLSLTEFFYPLMQGYDSVAMNVDAEIGGNDQLFNMLAGRTLLQSLKQKEKFVLTTKLIEGTDGRKMSKTYDNCIWLEDSAEEMFGKTLRVKDELITIYMECVTELPMSDVQAAREALLAGENPKVHKVALAKAIVALYHGQAEAERVAAEFDRVHRDGGVPDTMPEVTGDSAMLIVDLITQEKLVSSKSEARRLIEQGGLKLNDVAITDLHAKVSPGVLKVGKRKFLKVL